MSQLPSISAFAPQRGYAPNDDVGFAGSIVSLTGANFNVGQATVRFGDAAAQVLSRSPSRIDVRVPAIPPGPCTISVTTEAGTAAATETFAAMGVPVIDGLDPFGFSRDPSGENIVIAVSGSNLLVAGGRGPVALCRLSPRFDPNVQQLDASVILAVRPLSPSLIQVEIPAIPEFDRFIGGTGAIVLEFPDDLEIESESWDIEGL